MEMENQVGNQEENQEENQMEIQPDQMVEDQEQDLQDEDSSTSDISSLKSVGPDPGMTECGICLRNFTDPSLTTLPCGHIFDNECMLEWTQVYDVAVFSQARVRCPMCRAYLLYNCGDVISMHHLRPGVKILPQELTLNCQSYKSESDTHSLSSPERPLNPQTFAEIQAPAGQLQFQNFVPGNQAIFNSDDSNQGPEGPPNTVEDDDDEPQDIQMADVGHQGHLSLRPKHHDFRFMTSISQNPDPAWQTQTLDDYKVTKRTIANALDDGLHKVIEDAMQTQFEDCESYEDNHQNQFGIPINGVMWDNLERLWNRLRDAHREFQRQHEGFIYLSDVALEFRASREQFLNDKLEQFWGLYEYIDHEINKAYGNES
ncbi:hypothetical protein F4781DRAFT_438354 [Annulohypoxylon bovei var. microspora]|nr:hypothetical protein F4781DRAFT_438354 [Annulohypoxylon bovei var. microspora]